MKTTALALVGSASLILISCGPNEAEIAAAKEKATADSIANAAAMERTIALDLNESSVMWEGNMTGAKVYGHTGTLTLTEGKLVVKGGQVSEGSFTVNMASITPTDDSYAPEGSSEGTKAHLIGHLSSDSFFDVANHPTASFEITSVDGNTAIGQLTIRGTTNEEKVTDIEVSESDGMVKVVGNMVFDRHRYGATWDHPVQELLLANDISLQIRLVGTVQ